MITGKDLIAWGFTPGPFFKAAIVEANRLAQDSDIEQFEIIEALNAFAPPEPIYIPRHEKGTLGYRMLMDTDTDDEIA